MHWVPIRKQDRGGALRDIEAANAGGALTHAGVPLLEGLAKLKRYIPINITDQNVNELAHLSHRVYLIQSQAALLQGVVIFGVEVLVTHDE